MRNLFSPLLLCLFPAIFQAQPDCVLSNCCCGTPIEVGVPNGNFEDPPNPPPTGRITFYAGEDYSTWHINNGSIDLLGPNYSNFTVGNPNGPSQFIDLNGFEPGTISTTLTGLMPGANYTIVLWYAINPGATVASCNILVAGGAWLNATWSATNPGGVEWLEKCFSFTAQGTSAELRFIGSSNFTTAGMLLDDITMWACPVDTEPPTVGNPPVSPLMVACENPVPPPGDLQATDDCSTLLAVDFTESNIAQPCFYNLLRTWTITDECGNSTTVTQQIEVRDTEAPVFIQAPSDYTIACGEDYVSEFFSWLTAHGGAEALDNCDQALDWNYTFQTIPSGSCSATPATFTVTDDCGNQSTATAYFIIEDVDPPVLVQEALSDTVWCDENASDSLAFWLLTKGGALANDPCGPVSWINDFSGDSTAAVITVTFTANDQCNNSISTTASFVQLSATDTLFETATTCDAQQVGVDTTSSFSGACETVTITTTLLSPADSTLFFESSCNLTEEVVFTVTLSNQYGCDSLIITTISPLPNDTTLLFGESCDAAQAGVFTENLNNQYGCDSMVVTTIFLLPSDTTLLFGENCDATQAGVFTENLSNQYGCDSTVVTTISLLPGDTTLLFGGSCDAAQAGVFTQNLNNQFGCDSTVVTTIALLPGDTTLLFGESCDATQVGVFTQDLSNQFGCDSTVVTTISFLPSDTSYVFGTSCNMASVGVFTSNFVNQYGCDSTVITTILFSQTDTTLINSNSCDPASAGVFTQNLITPEGCDSVVITTVGLLPSDTTFFFENTCDPASAGVFVQNLNNQYGCDSTVIETVSLNQSDTTLLFATSCDPAQAGIFIQNLNNQYGCDSLVINTVSLLPSDTLFLFANTCDPASAGVFIQNLNNQFGCDSTVIQEVILTLPPEITMTVSDYAGFGVSCPDAADGSIQASVSGSPPFVFQWSNGASNTEITVLSPGTYTLTVSDVGGCSTTATATLIAPEDLQISTIVDQPDCSGPVLGNIKITAEGGVGPYLYSLDGQSFQTSGQFNDLASGQYPLVVQDANFCEKSDTVFINSVQQVQVDLGPDLQVELGDVALLQAFVNISPDSLASVVWTIADSLACPQCLSQSVMPLRTTVYTVEVLTPDGCLDLDTIVVFVDRRKSIYIPNAFSPNDDGVNDWLMIFAKPGTVARVKTFAVFDRWGEALLDLQNFPPNDPAYRWDGSFRGKAMNPGVYVWLAEIEFSDGETVVYSGDVLLVR